MEGFTVPSSPTGESFEAYRRTPGCVTVAITPMASQIVDYSKRPYSGFHLDLFNIIMQQLGWCYYLVPPEDNTVGVLINGSFTGAVGMIERKEADMMMGPVAVSSLRSSVVQYSYGYIWGDCALLYRRITHTEPDVFTLIKPFHLEVWFILALAVMVVGAAVVLINKFHLAIRSSHDAVTTASGERPRADVASKSFLWTWKIFVAQDLAGTPRGRPGRTLTVFWLVASFMMASMYRCNLKAILINDKVKIPFTNADEFVRQNEYSLTWIDGKIFGVYLKGQALITPDTAQGKMWAKTTHPVQSDEIISTVLSKKVAVLEPTLAVKSFVADDFSQRGECRLALADSGVIPAYMGFAFPLHSVLREHVDSVLLRLVQAGIPHHLQEHNMRNASWCLKPTSTSESRPIAVKDLLGIFFIHGVGLTLGLVSFLLELGVHRRTAKSHSRSPHSMGRLPHPQRGATPHPQRGATPHPQRGATPPPSAGGDSPTLSGGR